MEKVTIAQKLSLFNDYWNPRIVGELNGQHVKLAKFQGEFVWHKHDNEDEMFWLSVASSIWNFGIGLLYSRKMNF